MKQLSVTLCGLKFENPFILAPTPCTDELEMVKNGFRNGWSGAVLKTTHSEGMTIEPVSPLLWGLDFEDKKMVGLGNVDQISKYHVGIVEDRVRELKKEFPDKIVIASIVGEDMETLQDLTKRLTAAGADAIECSSGCPQDRVDLESGKVLSEDLEGLRQTVNWVKEAADQVPVLVKITGEIDIVALAQTAKEAGGDAVVVGGGRRAIMGVNLDTFVPYPSIAGKSTYASYTGPAVKPIILKLICEVSNWVDIPIISGGGSMTWQDALEAILLGASIIEFGTAVMFHGFRIVEDIRDGVEVYLEGKNISNISELIGQAVPNIVTQPELSREYRVIASINRDTCIKDDLCYISCRDGGHMAIELGEDRIPNVDEEKCVGCGLCQVVCPVWDCVTLKPKTKP
jgi:dihydropyrimidine dehydrogenase (NAD+) subunit PreA